jgi:hypothetical protein
MGKILATIRRSALDQACGAILVWLWNQFHFTWPGAIVGMIFSIITTAAAWPEFRVWQLFVLVAFMMGAGIWSVNGFFYFRDRRKRVRAGLSMTETAQKNTSTIKFSKKSYPERLFASATVGQDGQSIDCKFQSKITDPFKSCCYLIVDLREWSILDGQYLNKSKSFPGIPAVEIGTIEPRDSITKKILIIRRREFVFENGTFASHAYRARRGSVWTVTLIVTSKPETILQKDIHFKCTGLNAIELIDDLTSLQKSV